VLWRRSVEPSATGSGRSSSEPFRLAPESRGRPSNHANRPAATNGPAPATCCTSTPSGLFASAVPATPSPVTATAPAPSCACGLASNGVHSIVDDHSRYAYSELHRDVRAPTVTGFLERGLAAFAASRNRGQTADERQRLDVHPQPSTRRVPRPAAPRSTARSSGISKPSSASGRSGSATTQLARRPDTHQPRPQRPEARHLDRRSAPGQDLVDRDRVARLEENLELRERADV
jgi:hypothetical protein